MFVTQRWRDRRQRWRPVGDGGFDPDRYDVVDLEERTAAAFIARHHYAPSLPSTTCRYGLIEHRDAGDPRLVGVATLGVPMSRGVLTKVFPRLEPYAESLEFNRLVLLDSVASNGESWFSARALRRAAEGGVRGVVTFADPVARWRITGDVVDLVKPGHIGIVYQALNFQYCGRATARSLILLPDATVLTARAVAKVTGGERGQRGVVKRLVGLGAPEPAAGADLREWLRAALCHIGARRIRHPGNHRYALRVGTRAQRSRSVIALHPGTYPKPELALAIG